MTSARQLSTREPCLRHSGVPQRTRVGSEEYAFTGHRPLRRRVKRGRSCRAHQTQRADSVLTDTHQQSKISSVGTRRRRVRDDGRRTGRRPQLNVIGGFARRSADVAGCRLGQRKLAAPAGSLVLLMVTMFISLPMLAELISR
jgi:hypothetical protein